MRDGKDEEQLGRKMIEQIMSLKYRKLIQMVCICTFVCLLHGSTVEADCLQQQSDVSKRIMVNREVHVFVFLRGTPS